MENIIITAEEIDVRCHKKFARYILLQCPDPERPDPLFRKALTLVLLRTGEEDAVLLSAYAGEKASPEPWSPWLTDAERESARAFWSAHALACPESDLRMIFCASAPVRTRQMAFPAAHMTS